MTYPVYYPIEGDTLPIFFDTFAGSTGASITMTGLAVTDIEIYKDGSTTQRASDAGYTLLDTDGIDFDSLTGIHGFSIDLSDNTDAGFYTVGPWYHVIVSAITVDSQTVSFIAAAFRILDDTRGMAGTALPDAAADAAGGLPISDAGGLDMDAILVDTNSLNDTKIPNTLNTTASGNIGIDWANVENPTSIVDLSATDIQLVDTTTTNTDMVSEPPTAAAIADQVWDEAKSGHVGAGSFGEEVQAHALSSELTTHDGKLDTVDANVDAILADTNELQTDWANGGRLDVILDARAAEATVAALNDISVADILTTQMAEAYAADGAAPTVAQALMMIQQMLGEFAISSTTLTVKKLDGSTTAATYTLDDATTPTSITRAT